MKRISLILLAFSLLAVVFSTSLYAEETEPGVRKSLLKSVSVFAKNGGRIAWSPDGERIAFDRKNADGYFDIYTVKLDGKGLVSVTDGKEGIPQANNGNPAWHKSGGYIIFQAQNPALGGLPKGPLGKYVASSGIGINNDIWIAKADGSKFWPVTRAKERFGSLHPHFSPDGKHITWSEIITPGRGIRDWEIKLADFSIVDGESLVSNIRALRPLNLQFYEMHGFSSDGKTLLFSGIKKDGFYFDLEIYTYDIQTKRTVQLTNDGNWDEHAHFSPDGKHIIWPSSRDIPQKRWEKMQDLIFGKLLMDIWIMDADRKNKRRLTYFNEKGSKENQLVGDGHPGDIDWAPDGKRIIAKYRGINKRELCLIIELEDAAFDAKPVAAKSGYTKEPGPYKVKFVRLEWQDEKRKREIPVKIYYPENIDKPCPVVIFSHGGGGSRENYRYLANYWVSHGYISVHLQHKGSDVDVIRGKKDPMGALREAVMKPMATINRPLDVTFAIDMLGELNKDDKLFSQMFALDKIAIAGHSFGASTTMCVAGQRFKFRNRELTWGDPRVKAAIPMSPTPLKDKSLNVWSYENVKIPCLHMTGTLDDSPIVSTTAADRRVPYDSCAGPGQYLITFAGGDHLIFSLRLGKLLTGRGCKGDPSKDALFQGLIKMSSLAFLDAYLKGDANAQSWLADGGFAKTLGADGKLEKK